MQTSLNARDHDRYETETHSSLRGLVTLLACAFVLIGLAYAAMILLTSPEGLVTQATLTSFQGGETMTLVSTSSEPAR